MRIRTWSSMPRPYVLGYCHKITTTKRIRVSPHVVAMPTQHNMAFALPKPPRLSLKLPCYTLFSSPLHVKALYICVYIPFSINRLSNSLFFLKISNLISATSSLFLSPSSSSLLYLHSSNGCFFSFFSSACLSTFFYPINTKSKKRALGSLGSEEISPQVQSNGKWWL